jgi:isoleucyl-tRNA synthetase
LNIRSVNITSEEEKYGIKYRVEGDPKSLGKKFKRDAGKIRKALGELSLDKVKAFMAAGSLEVEGYEITEEDVQVIRFFDSGDFESNTDKEVIVLVDIKLRSDLIEEGTAREVVNRVQRLRKKCGLIPTDNVTMYFDLQNDVDGQVGKVLSCNPQHEAITKILKKELVPISQHKEKEFIVQEEQEVSCSQHKHPFNPLTT